MNKLRFLVSLPILAIAVAIPAQEGKPAKQEPQGNEKPKKDDKVTANDPAIQAIDKLIKSVDTKTDGWRLRLSTPPKQEFQANCEYFWHVDTAAGPLKIRLFGDTAPMHVTSAIYLARLGFYDGLNFHRIIPGFMAQGGCPEGSGRGSPGYKYDGEFKGGRKHDKPGILSMANAGPGTDGSQFFLTFVPTPHLDGRHTVWGEVVDGAETLKALEKLGSRANNGMLANGPKMKSTWITVEAKKAEKPAEPAKDGEKKGDGGDGR